MTKNPSFSSLVNLQSKSINFTFGHFSAKYQGYSLTFWPNIAHFHHFSICYQNQSISILIISRQNTKVIALLFGQKSLIFITLQSKSINSILVMFRQNTKVIALLFAKNPSFSSPVNLQSNSIISIMIICGQKYQGYSLTFWPKIAHFHHFSICYQNQSISILVIFRQNTKVIALLFGQKSLIIITFQSAIKINQFQFWSCVGKNTKVIALIVGQKSLIFITPQSAIKINQFHFWSFLGKIPRLYPYVLAKNPSFSSLVNLQSKSINLNFGHFSAKYQGYSLTFWPKIAHFHHFSICNQNQSISILVICRKILRLLLYGNCGALIG